MYIYNLEEEKMKKIAAVLCLLLLVLPLGTSCKSADGEDNVLTVALSPDFAPMEFVDTSKEGQDQYVGFDVTLAKFIAEQMGKTLEIKAMSFEACQVAVQTGAVDLGISGFSWTADREENYLISDYYIAGENETQQTIIVLAENAGKYTNADAFAGLKVAAQAASLQEQLCKEALPADISLELFKDINDAVLALQTGKVDAVAVADGNADAIIANNPDVAKSGFFFDVDPKYENNVILINKNDTQLLEEVNGILAKAMAEDLYSGWYEDAKALSGIDTAQELTIEDEPAA